MYYLAGTESQKEMATPNLHIAMYPFFAIGHLTPFLRLANKLAKKGFKISFLVPTKTASKLTNLNLHPQFITFIPITVPHVDGLPPGFETTSDVPYPLHPLIMTAMDRTQADVEAILQDLNPNLVFFDFTEWMPELARGLGIKSIYYSTVSSVTVCLGLRLAKELEGSNLIRADLTKLSSSLPDSSVKLHSHEAQAHVAVMVMKFGSDISFFDRHYFGTIQSDALSFRTCREIEGPFIDHLESQFGKHVLLSGPVLPEPPTSTLDPKWAKWLAGFQDISVIYCAFGSECNLKKDQFQELLFGLELTGMPFLAALKPPMGVNSIEEALPEGFEERINGRGVVHGGWVQQQLILEHPSVGCFITHCGTGSLSEALVNKCQVVLLPHVAEQIINARLMSSKLRIGVEVEKREEDGWFSKESVCKAVKIVMEEDSEVGKEVRANHEKLRELLLAKDLESSYIDSFTEQLQLLVG